MQVNASNLILSEPQRRYGWFHGNDMICRTMNPLNLKQSWGILWHWFWCWQHQFHCCSGEGGLEGDMQKMIGGQSLTMIFHMNYPNQWSFEYAHCWKMPHLIYIEGMKIVQYLNFLVPFWPSKVCFVDEHRMGCAMKGNDPTGIHFFIHSDSLCE